MPASHSYQADLVAPTVTMTGPEGLQTGAFWLTLTFSEPVTGFEQGDLTVGNGSVAEFSGEQAGYRAKVTPAASGTVTVDVAANVAVDADGNGNKAARRFSVQADLGMDDGAANAPPSITRPPDRTYAQGETIAPFAFRVADEDPGTLNVTVDGLPSGLTSTWDPTSESVQVQGTVSPTAAAQAYTVEVIAIDAMHGVGETFTITVTEADPVAPAVTHVEVVSDAGEDGAYALGETIRVRLTFGAAVHVTGAPRLRLDLSPLAGGELWATYASGFGDGTAGLVFTYTVAASNISTEGIAVLADTLELNGGTIASAGGGVDAVLAHDGLGHDPNHRVDGKRPQMVEAAVDGTALTITFDEDLAPATQAPEQTGLRYRFFVKGTIVGSEQSPARVTVDGRVVALHLNTPAEAGQQITVSYSPGGSDPLRDAAGNQAAAFTDRPVTNRKSGPQTPANSPATGAPTITGTAKVGETLTAETAPIAGADGLTGATFAYQWLSNDGVADSDIAGATGASYTLADADEGRTVKVRVAFTDDAGNHEALTSAATGPVVAPPLTARVESPATFESATTLTYDGVGFILTFSKEIMHAGVHTDYTVMVDGKRRETTRAGSLVNTVGLVLAEPLWWGETVTVAYAKPSDGAMLRDADGLAVESFGPEAVANMLKRNPATGAPTITGIAKVGDTLTASTAGIADADGLSEPTFRYQWFTDADSDIASAGGGKYGDAIISDATGASYTLTDAQVGARVKVQVMFIDDAGNLEMLTSAATDPVVARPLTAPVENPATFESATTVEQGRTLMLTFTKEILHAGLHTDYTVRVDGELRETKQATWPENTVGLVLEAPVRWGETVTVAYAKPSDGEMLHDADGLAIGSFGPEAVENTVPQPANTPATGAPAITGSAKVGETLTASTAAIADADGLAEATFAYQWLSVNPASGEADDIAGATGASYTLVDADEYRMVKVRVTFTDDAGNAETLTSAASGLVVALATFESAATVEQGRGLMLTFTKTILSAGVLTDYTVLVDGERRETTHASWPGNTVGLVLAEPVRWGETITVAYAKPSDGMMLLDADLLAIESFGPETVENTVPRSLTASFVGVPGEHDGRTAFSFELRFSENFPGRLDYQMLKDQALQVTNGRPIDVKRAAPGQNQRWTIKVRPWSVDDVTVTLAAGSVRTESGRALSSTTTARVLGPPRLSVADAEAREGQDAAVEFAVTLSRAASAAVTVDYATADGTAIAGEDYTAASGTLTFAVGETRKTVTVPVLDDTHDEGRETFTLTLSDAQGAAIADGEATGTIVNTDTMPKAWTARFGRSVAVHVVDAVEARLDEASGSWVQLGGRRLGGGPGVHETVPHLSPQRDLWAEAGAAGIPGQHMTTRDLLLGSAFHLVSNPGDEAIAPRLSAWGRVATSGFDGREDKVSLDGTVTTATLGVDGVWDRWLTGLVLAYSEGDGAYSHADMPGGDLSSSLTSVHPYVAYTLSDRVRLWGLVGYGSGALQLRLGDQRAMDTDLTMSMGAVGIRGTLLQPAQPGGLELALRSDVLWMGMDSAAAHNLAATEADASRLRLVLEGSRPVTLAGGGSFTPSLEVGLRHDGGDAETGTGLEVGGRLRYASAWGLSIEASLRGLLAHEASDYREWGASAALRFDPGRQGRGFTASVMPAWGTPASGVERLWGRPGTPGLAPADPLATAAAGRLEGELGYGLAALNGHGLLTPYARVALTEGADQAWHLGTRLAVAESLNFSLEASRRAREGGMAAHELALRANLGW